MVLKQQPCSEHQQDQGGHSGVDYRRSRRTEHAPLLIHGEAVERVNNIKFLGIHITSDLTWSMNTAHLVKKAQQRLFFLRKLKRAGLSPQLLTNFYRATIESILCLSAAVCLIHQTQFQQIQEVQSDLTHEKPQTASPDPDQMCRNFSYVDTRSGSLPVVFLVNDTSESEGQRSGWTAFVLWKKRDKMEDGERRRGEKKEAEDERKNDSTAHKLCCMKTESSGGRNSSSGEDSRLKARGVFDPMRPERPVKQQEHRRETPTERHGSPAAGRSCLRSPPAPRSDVLNLASPTLRSTFITDDVIAS
ncbi:hypothetical protein L3Q82_004854 [Scortum barcoo]|uniref:Uncharacterized protein n=1 Tax=Scortum barcoo TaxID=214431 RepID=A0ACB8VDR5_9TELE|nr:hypothetical protein L3Q82_004854 [Scortum barcoo]